MVAASCAKLKMLACEVKPRPAASVNNDRRRPSVNRARRAGAFYGHAPLNGGLARPTLKASEPVRRASMFICLKKQRMG